MLMKKIKERTWLLVIGITFFVIGFGAIILVSKEVISSDYGVLGLLGVAGILFILQWGLIKLIQEL